MQTASADLCAMDLAELLAYAAPRNAIKADCKGGTETMLPSAGGQQVILVIPERDVYRLVMHSRQPGCVPLVYFR